MSVLLTVKAQLFGPFLSFLQELRIWPIFCEDLVESEYLLPNICLSLCIFGKIMAEIRL